MSSSNTADTTGQTIYEVNFDYSALDRQIPTEFNCQTIQRMQDIAMPSTVYKSVLPSKHNSEFSTRLGDGSELSILGYL